MSLEGPIRRSRTLTPPPHPSPLPQDSYSFPDISLDFGLAEGAPTDMELYVIGWPRRISLEVQVQQALVAEDPLPEDEPDSDAPPALYITLPYLKKWVLRTDGPFSLISHPASVMGSRRPVLRPGWHPGRPVHGRWPAPVTARCLTASPSCPPPTLALAAWTPPKWRGC